MRQITEVICTNSRYLTYTRSPKIYAVKLIEKSVLPYVPGITTRAGACYKGATSAEDPLKEIAVIQVIPIT